MRLSRNELIAKLSLGEDSLLECKEVRFSGASVRGPSQNDLADELAAFANSRTGGTLLLGIDDKTRDVLGIPVDRLDLVEALVRQAVEDSIKPPLAPVIERLKLPDSLGVEHPVCRIDIAPSLFVHQSPSGYLHRVGSSKRPIPPDYLAQLFQQRSQSRLIRFDELPVVSAQCEDLDTVLLDRFQPQLSPDSNWQSKAGLVVEAEDGSLHPSVAGVLLASLNPQQFLRGAYIQAVAYAGTEVAPQGEDAMYQRDAADLTGPLDQQITAACRFVARNSRTGAVKTLEGGRIDRPQFDALALFEAITNAVAHRDYSIPGSKVRLRLFDDRLEIFSPGMLPNTMTPESLPLRQACRNELVASLLARCPVEAPAGVSHRRYIMDRRGEGVPLILSRTLELSGQLPHYRLIDSNELLLTIPSAL
jgi:predicted HTH transcriptional regulator